MTGQTIRLTTPLARARALGLVDRAPDGAVVNIRPANRTTEQNAKMWAMLSDVSRAKPDGRELTPEVWKSLFLHALGHAQRFEMALDGNGVVPVGFRSSRLTKDQMSELIEMIYEFGARHDVRWSDEPQQEDRAA
jgi:hypothetical protein